MLITSTFEELPDHSFQLFALIVYLSFHLDTNGETVPALSKNTLLSGKRVRFLNESVEVFLWHLFGSILILLLSREAQKVRKWPIIGTAIFNSVLGIILANFKVPLTTLLCLDSLFSMAR